MKNLLKKMSILITRPNSDNTLNYLYHWTYEVIKFAQSKKLTFYDLRAKKANKKTFLSYLRKQKPSFIFFNGHGTRNKIYGDDNEVLLDNDSNLELLKDTVIYSRTCSSASVLGIELVRNGSLAFVGYKRDFIFYHLPGYHTQPTNDPLARRFIEPTNLIPTTLMKGHTVVAAHLRSVRAMYKNYFEMVSSRAAEEERVVASFLWGNIMNQVIMGDRQAKI